METMYQDVVKQLRTLNWDFEDSKTNTLTHRYHPYPAKFIPQIPRNLIEIFSRPGDQVLDPFCGSGTALVESILLDRDALGIDINPLSTLIAKVKATPLQPEKLRSINDLLLTISQKSENSYGQKTLFAKRDDKENYSIPDFPKITFWFEKFVIDEVALIKHHIYQIQDDDLKDFLKVSLSSILVTVSRQDSDTRYTRREKNIKPGDTVRIFAKRVRDMADAMRSFTERASKRRPIVLSADSQDLESLVEPNSVDLVVTSPPYPNAYSYHLYHRNRMFWLDIDPYPVKKQEIGSHRKYSAKNGATAETFRIEMRNCFRGLHLSLRSGGFCCVVIGDSIIRGELVLNNELLKDVAVETGFDVIDDIRRNIQATRKAFNPTIGRIKQESILVFGKV